MSSKSKRSVSSSSVQTRTAPVAAAASSGRKYSAGVEFNPDYSEVKKSLKKIGILAVSFVALLVVLSFFIH